MQEQIELFNLLRERALSSAALAQWISENLGVSLATAYKKINGQVRLTWDEYKKIDGPAGNWLMEAAGGHAIQELFRANPSPVQMIEFWINTINSIQNSNQEIVLICHELPQVYLFDAPLAAAYCLFQQFKLQEPTNPQSFNEFNSALPERFNFLAKELKQTFLKIKRVEILDPFGFRPFPRGLIQMKKQQFIDYQVQKQLTEVYAERANSWQMERDTDRKVCIRKLSPLPLLYNFLMVRENGKILWEPFGIQNLKITPGIALRPLRHAIEDIEAASSDISNCSLSRAYVDKKGKEYQNMLLNEDY